MKKLTISFAILFCLAILTSLAFAQTFPPVWVQGPFPTGTEEVRDDAPCDVTLPDEMGTIHEYTAYRGTPVIDGIVNDDPVWNSIPWTAMNKYTVAGGESCFLFDDACEDVENYWGPEDISAWFKILWDDDQVYFALFKVDDEYVYDETHMGDSQSSIWQDDAYQIVLDANDPYDQGGPLPSAEIGLAVLGYTETAYNSWRNTNGDPLELADGNSESAVASGDGKGFFGLQTEGDDGYTEIMEVAFVKWDEIEADTPQMFSIMANDPDEIHTVDGLEFSQGIFNGKLAERYASIVYSSLSAPVEAVEYKLKSGLLTDFLLLQNYPNPFNPTTTISYAVNTTGNVELNVYDLLGHQVATLVNGVQTAGNYQVTFDARDLSSGVYIYTLKSAESVMTNKMVLMK